MSVLLIIVALLLAFLGHGALWITFWNHTEGSAMPKWMRRWINLFGKLCLFGLPIALPLSGALGILFGDQSLTSLLGAVYLTICWCMSLIGIPYAIYRRRSLANPPCQLSRRVITHDLTQPLEHSTASGLGRLLLRLSGNQVYQLEATEKEVALKGLPESLDGFRLVHLSDLHFTGKIAQGYFQRLVEITNSWQPDLIAITGDLVDVEGCMSWIPETLGKLQARYGTHYVLGNHDLKVNLRRLRSTLRESGLRACGGRWLTVDVDGSELLLAGNELPWVPPAVDMTDCPAKHADQLRLLLAHSPDQLAWAKHHAFDLMLAGHTHGGQICLPGIGAVLCPSRKPLEYCVGTIHEPPTVMHVSRGASCEVPIRINCPPEITNLVLRCAQPKSAKLRNSTESFQGLEKLTTRSEPEQDKYRDWQRDAVS